MTGNRVYALTALEVPIKVSLREYRVNVVISKITLYFSKC